MDGFASVAVAPKGELPLVVGVVTVNMTGQMKLARKAIDSFVQQTYPNKKLVVVAPHALDNLPEDAMLVTAPPAAHRDLFELGRASAPNSSLVCWWPYDSYSPPLRLDRQMSAQRAGLAVSFDTVLLYDALNDNATVVGSRHGFAATSLFPRHMPTVGWAADVSPAPPTPYQSLVLGNGLPRYMPMIRFRDQVSNYPAGWFLPPGSTAGTQRSWGIGDELSTYLRSVLKKYGMEEKPPPVSSVRAALKAQGAAK